MRALVLLALCGSLTVSSINGLRYVSEKYDSVVIVPDSDNEAIDFLPEVTTVPPPPNHCTTTAGVSGKCIPYDRCYPYGNFFMGEIRSVGEEYNRLEIFDILNSTDTCVPTGEGSEAVTFICCPSPDETLRVRSPENETSEVGSLKLPCGERYEAIKKVVGGRPATPGEFPWAVALLNKGRQFCGASLISQNYVLTAAHCVYGMQDVSGMTLKIGDHDWSSEGEAKSETRRAVKVLYHRGFSMNTLNNDVALIKLSSPVTITGNIRTVCLNSDAVPVGDRADLAGWGKISNSGPPSRTLRTVSMRVNSPEECRREYQGTQAPPITSGMICAGEKSPGLKDACNGDSGGPLTYSKNGPARQIGIVSWGIGCGEKYGVYTNVKEYLPWIQKNSQS